MNNVTNQGCRTRIKGGHRRGRKESGFVLIVTCLAISMWIGFLVSVHYPPTRGFYAGKNNAVEAIVTRNNQTYFMGLFGLSSAPVAGQVRGPRDEFPQLHLCT